MKQIFVFALAMLMIACDNNSAEKKEETKIEPVSENPLLTEEEKKDGWQLLFDGLATDGWHNYGGGPVGYAWKISGGTLHFDGSQKKDTIAQDIVSDEEFENFHLKLEWQVDTNGNSGILFYVKEDTTRYKKPYHTGPEMQVLDNNGHPDAKITKHRAGDLYDLVSCSKETVRPALQWNQVEIKCANGELDFWLNGENVVSTQLWDDNWKKMLANSKFKEWPDFGTFKKGRISLQDHGDKVWFRNIKIKKL
ncbi:MAG TPA: DUF1080 domain-containing protein [Chitinophagaceae bacterium]|nr:DUF1080 domain-containing protein [Chitinophagaceae bacterium]